MFVERKFVILGLICAFGIVVAFLGGNYVRYKRLDVLRKGKGFDGLLDNVSRSKETFKLLLRVVMALLYGVVLAGIGSNSNIDLIWKIFLVTLLVIDQSISRRIPGKRIVIGKIKKSEK